jgi:hypothetical protein
MTISPIHIKSLSEGLLELSLLLEDITGKKATKRCLRVSGENPRLANAV